jgi:hypothetical protein
MVNTVGNAVTVAGMGWRIQGFSKDPAAHQFLHDAHFPIGNAAYRLIGLHTLAALAHHVVFQDVTRKTRIMRQAGQATPLIFKFCPLVHNQGAVSLSLCRGVQYARTSA